MANQSNEKHTTIAQEILNQLGGNKFIVMTGSKNFIDDGNTLRMSLAKNMSKANLLHITLDGDDTYTMRFIKHTPIRVNRKTLNVTDEKTEIINETNGLLNAQLQAMFTHITGMDTSLGTMKS